MTLRNHFHAARGVYTALFILIAFGALFSLRSCNSDPLPVIPEGEQTLTGVLLPLSISLSRRGTHVLVQNGEESALVESASVNLRQVEGVEVVIVGHFELNTDPDALPVLVASGVTLINLQMRTWQLPFEQMTIDAPISWNPAFFSDGVRFSQTGGTVFLAISTTSMTSLPPSGRLTVAGRQAALVHGTGAQTLYIQNGSSMITLEFADDIAGSDALIMRIIRGLRFSSSSSAPSVSQGGSGAVTSVAGIPCGGAAGILCPSGQYCEITDSASNIGRCRTVQR